MMTQRELACLRVMARLPMWHTLGDIAEASNGTISREAAHAYALTLEDEGYIDVRASDSGALTYALTPKGCGTWNQHDGEWKRLP